MTKLKNVLYIPDNVEFVNTGKPTTVGEAVRGFSRKLIVRVPIATYKIDKVTCVCSFLTPFWCIKLKEKTIEYTSYKWNNPKKPEKGHRKTYEFEKTTLCNVLDVRGVMEKMCLFSPIEGTLFLKASKKGTKIRFIDGFPLIEERGCEIPEEYYGFTLE